MKIINFFTVLTLCALLLFCILPIHGEGEIYGKVLRLHVIANSDSDLDQSLKLEVRDSVLKYTAPLLREAESREEAAEVIMRNRADIEAVARKRLELLGMLTVKSKEHNGRLRKYYHITGAGLRRIEEFKRDWKEIKSIYDFVVKEDKR